MLTMGEQKILDLETHVECLPMGLVFLIVTAILIVTKRAGAVTFSKDVTPGLPL